MSILSPKSKAIWPGLSGKFAIGGWTDLDRRLCTHTLLSIINITGHKVHAWVPLGHHLSINWTFEWGSKGQSPRALQKFRKKHAKFQLPVSLEPFDWFWCSKFWLRALDVCFHSILIAGTPDPYSRQKTAAAGSYGQPCTPFSLPDPQPPPPAGTSMGQVAC